MIAYQLPLTAIGFKTAPTAFEEADIGIAERLKLAAISPVVEPGFTD